MLFNSLHFAVFFCIVFGVYWLLRNRWQNRMLLVASYYFYGCWDWRFLSLILLSTIIDFWCGRKIAEAQSAASGDRRAEGNAQEKSHPRSTTKDREQRAGNNPRVFLWTSIIANLGILGFFKYFNFFSESLQAALGTVGLQASWPTLNIVLPVGISFYTFQTMSYTIDIYRGKLKPVHNFFDFALFVAFFPQLVAGPIERATHLVPEILRKRVFNRAQFIDGLHLIAAGLFKKVVIADNLAGIVDQTFSRPESYSSLGLLAGIYAFALQIYCDFSGYSDVARGICKTMGFELCLNFKRPYFATNPSEFWRRWHISLSSWLRDYLYISLGGSRGGMGKTYRNLMLTMLLGGLWHGAAWTFIIWGAYQGILLVVHRLVTSGKEQSTRLSTLKRATLTVAFFQLVCVGWLIFRAEGFANMTAYMKGLLSFQHGWHVPVSLWVPVVSLGGLLFAIQIWQEKTGDVFVWRRLPLWIQAIGYGVGTYLFCFLGASTKAFIYFQF